MKVSISNQLSELIRSSPHINVMLTVVAHSLSLLLIIDFCCWNWFSVFVPVRWRCYPWREQELPGGRHLQVTRVENPRPGRRISSERMDAVWTEPFLPLSLLIGGKLTLTESMGKQDSVFLVSCTFMNSFYFVFINYGRTQRSYSEAQSKMKPRGKLKRCEVSIFDQQREERWKLAPSVRTTRIPPLDIPHPDCKFCSLAYSAGD